MKVHLIKKKTIYHYLKSNSNASQGFEIWLRILNIADWDEPKDILNSFISADILGKGTNRVIFDIGGNKYRCICAYSFGENFVHLFVKWIGTHAEYTKLCKSNQQYTISIY